MKSQKTLHTIIGIFSLMALLNLTRVSAADLLNDPVLGGGEISYTPPFAMTHSIEIERGLLVYNHGTERAIVFQIENFGSGTESQGTNSFADANDVSIEVMKRGIEASYARNPFAATNVAAKIIKIDGHDAVELYAQRVPGMWADHIVMFWHKDTIWSKTTGLTIVVFDSNEDDRKKLIESVKSAKYFPPSVVSHAEDADTVKTEYNEAAANGATAINLKTWTTTRAGQVIIQHEERDLTHNGKFEQVDTLIFHDGKKVLHFSTVLGKRSCFFYPEAGFTVLQSDTDGDGRYDRISISDAHEQPVDSFTIASDGKVTPIPDADLKKQQDLLKRFDEAMKNFDKR